MRNGRAWIILVGVAAAGAYLLSRSRIARDALRPAGEDIWKDPDIARAAIAKFLSTITNPPNEEEQRVLFFFPEIDQARRTFGMHSGLIAAIIDVESDGYPSARGAKGEYGLMQLIYTTAIIIGYAGPPDGLLDPATNIHYGVKYLRKQWDRYAERPLPHTWVVAAYNAGTAYPRDGGFTNQGYVDSVLGKLDRYDYLVNQIYSRFGYRPRR